MSQLYVLVHGAWHSGAQLKPTADALEAQGHTVHCPSAAGNRPGEANDVGLSEAIASITAYLVDHDLREVVLVGHSYGGMLVTGVLDQVPERLARVVYVNGFVPNDGESLEDLAPPFYGVMFKELAEASSDNAVSLPYPIWREAFINDADATLAQSAYATLAPQPYRTLTDKIALERNPADHETPKSYINCTEDTAMPHSMPWHPRLSEKLGLFRLVQTPGSHELLFTDPKALADAIVKAGRD